MKFWSRKFCRLYDTSCDLQGLRQLTFLQQKTLKLETQSKSMSSSPRTTGRWSKGIISWLNNFQKHRNTLTPLVEYVLMKLKTWIPTRTCWTWSMAVFLLSSLVIHTAWLQESEVLPWGIYHIPGHICETVTSIQNITASSILLSNTGGLQNWLTGQALLWIFFFSPTHVFLASDSHWTLSSWFYFHHSAVFHHHAFHLHMFTIHISMHVFHTCSVHAFFLSTYYMPCKHGSFVYKLVCRPSLFFS